MYRLYRSRDDRMLAGVAGGLAELWGADPSLVRVIWALLVVFTGGVALYGVVIAAAFHTFVRVYEEPTLHAAYGEEYAAYCAATPRWIPRFRR